MAATLSPDEGATLRGLISDPVAYIEHLLWIQDVDDRIVRQQRRKARVRRSLKQVLDCTDPKLTIARVRAGISEQFEYRLVTEEQGRLFA